MGKSGEKLCDGYDPVTECFFGKGGQKMSAEQTRARKREQAADERAFSAINQAILRAACGSESYAYALGEIQSVLEQAGRLEPAVSEALALESARLTERLGARVFA
jgi:hypothetical protein